MCRITRSANFTKNKAFFFWRGRWQECKLHFSGAVKSTRKSTACGMTDWEVVLHGVINLALKVSPFSVGIMRMLIFNVGDAIYCDVSILPNYIKSNNIEDTTD